MTETPQPGISDDERAVLDVAPWRSAFLIALTEGATVAVAARKAGVSYRTTFDHRKKDPAFRRLADEAHEMGTDAIEHAATERAIVGHERPIWSHGKVAGTIREPSDRLLELLLRARRPEKFRENVRVDGTIKVPGADALSPAVTKLIEAALAVGRPPRVEPPTIEGEAEHIEAPTPRTPQHD
jgi:hypothetical protein